MYLNCLNTFSYNTLLRWNESLATILNEIVNYSIKVIVILQILCENSKKAVKTQIRADSSLEVQVDASFYNY